MHPDTEMKNMKIKSQILSFFYNELNGTSIKFELSNFRNNSHEPHNEPSDTKESRTRACKEPENNAGNLVAQTNFRFTNSSHPHLSLPKNQLNHMSSVPINLETLMLLATLICLDALLYDLTFMPIQALLTLSRFTLKEILALASRMIKIQPNIPGSRLTNELLLNHQGSNSINRELNPRQKHKRPNSIKGKKPGNDLGNFSRNKDSTQTYMENTIHPEINLPALNDSIRFSLLLLSILIFSLIDMSRLYHYIRAQPFMKLYVIFNMLEIFERLCRSIGRDMMDSLISSVIHYLDRYNLNFQYNTKLKKPVNFQCPKHQQIKVEYEEKVKIEPNNAEQPFIQKISLLAQYLAVLFYILAHSFLHLIRVLSLSIAINSSESIMFIIVVTNNFGEIKSTVFKKYTDKTLFQIVSSDVVERFLFFCDAFIVYLRISTSRGFNISSYIQNFTWLLFVFSLEFGVDWIKHCFIVKFNLISANAFTQYKKILLADIIISRLSSSREMVESHMFNVPFKSVYGFSLIPSRRIGFMALPVVTLIICCIPKVTWNSQYFIFSAAILWLCLLFLKFLISLLMLAYAITNRKHIQNLDSTFNTISAL